MFRLVLKLYCCRNVSLGSSRSYSSMQSKKNFCNHEGCNKELKSFTGRDRHFCGKCERIFCNEHTHAAHSRIWTCQYRSKCICHSCWIEIENYKAQTRAPSRVQSRTAQSRGRKHWETARRHIRDKKIFEKFKDSGKED